MSWGSQFLKLKTVLNLNVKTTLLSFGAFFLSYKDKKNNVYRLML